jgi:hypothetical protein
MKQMLSVVTLGVADLDRSREFETQPIASPARTLPVMRPLVSSDG